MSPVPLHVLLVDDSEDDCFLILRELKKAGYTPVHKRVDNENDFRRALENPFLNLILCDFNMPSLTGMEVLSIVREKELDIPFIIVSGVIGEETAVQAMKAGAHDFLMKNKLARLIPAVERELREYKVRSERKGSILALKESEDKYRRIFESTGTAMVIIEENLSISLANSETLRLSGYTWEEIRQKNWPDFVYPQDAELMKKYNSLRRVSPEQVPSKYEFRFITKDGGLKTVFGTFSMIPDSHRCIVSMLDITHLKWVEKTLQKNIQELAKSNEELKEFASVASHDLQEPLRMIMSYTQLFARRYREKMGAEADEFIDYIVESAAQMKELINGLLAYTRVGVKKNFQTFPMEKALIQALRYLKSTVDEAYAVVEYKDLPVVTADYSQMVQLFQNLIQNAIKFKGEERPLIRIGAVKQEKEWVFSIQDNGIGIEEQYFGTIFKIFERLHTKNMYPGTGIGLAICKKIVDNHEGRIGVESKINEGSTFYFSIAVKGES